MCKGGQSESASLLHQERVFIRRFLCVVLERHTLPPQPVKLALLKLVPHWEVHNKDSATRKHFNMINTTVRALTNTHPMERLCGLKKPPNAGWAGMPAAPVHSGSSLLAASVHRYYELARTHGDLGLQGHALNVKHKNSKHKFKRLLIGRHSLSFSVWVMYWIWSEGVRKLPWCSSTSHVRAFKICNKSMHVWLA